MRAAARDAAGSGKIVQVHVRGAVDGAAAHAIAQAVARSTSVRWACAHAVADWGGLLVAVGASGADLRPDLLELRIGSTAVMIEGAATHFDAKIVVQALSNQEIELVVDLHMGNQSATVWTCTAAVEY